MKLIDAGEIRELREQLHLSQRYVAARIGVNPSTFAQMENGKIKISVEDLQKLCELYGVSADSIMKNDQAEIMNLIRFKEQMKDGEQDDT